MQFKKYVKHQFCLRLPCSPCLQDSFRNTDRSWHPHLKSFCHFFLHMGSKSPTQLWRHSMNWNRPTFHLHVPPLSLVGVSFNAIGFLLESLMLHSLSNIRSPHMLFPPSHTPPSLPALQLETPLHPIALSSNSPFSGKPSLMGRDKLPGLCWNLSKPPLLFIHGT